MKRNLLVVFLLIIGITITAKAGEVMSSEVEMKAMVVEISSSELQKLGIEKTKESFTPEEFQTIRTKLQTGEIKSKILEFPPLRTIDGTQASFSFGSRGEPAMIFIATPKIDGNKIIISMKLQLVEEGKMVGSSTIISVKNGETVLVGGMNRVHTHISGLGEEEKEDLNTMIFVTANIIDSQRKSSRL